MLLLVFPVGLVVLGVGFMMLMTFLAAMLVLHRTRFGQYVYSIGGGAQAARLMGVPLARTTIGIYAPSGGLAGLAGIASDGREPSGGR